MFAAKIVIFETANSDEPTFDDDVLASATSIVGDFVEVMATVNKENIYFVFRKSDLLREIKEMPEDN